MKLSRALFKKHNVEQIALNAQAGQAAWKAVSIDKKRDIFFKASDLLTKRSDQIATIMEIETGAPKFFGEKFIADAISYLKEMGTLVASRSPVLVPPVPGAELKGNRSAMVFREPIGPVLSIVPWNAAAVLAMRAATCPLAAGCSVIFKTSPLAEKSHTETLNVLFDAGVPENVLQLVHADELSTPEVVSGLIGDPIIRKINFTGSYQVGRKVAIEAAQHVKPLLLELGGKGVVLVDCDTVVEQPELLNKCAANIVIGAWGNAGQVCMSTERVIIYGSTASRDKVASRVEQTAKELFDAPFLQAHQVTVAAATKIQSLIDDAVEKGAVKCAISDNLSVVDEGWVAKTVLRGVSPEMQIYHEETFGPVFWINEVDTAKEAVEIANDSQYGLNSAVWTGNIQHGLYISSQVESGSVHINGSTIFDHGTIPHGGVKSSGYGRFGGTWGIDEFTSLKLVTLSGNEEI